ncbi:hypothetical protein L2E82_09795 [Cichorium intybus]|uniref:Uncharacterized protein n=1 Tax=Cichorium intybus TaxID=13427 RepID=A0ACB9GAA5_CICIN|nr:hypothetical protein L2E82_09795 [Cichorium intybus]
MTRCYSRKGRKVNSRLVIERFLYMSLQRYPIQILLIAIMDYLRLEIVLEIKKLGRVLLIDLADIIGVDLYHVEKQAQIDDRLQECCPIALAEIAAQLQVGSQLLATV